MRTRNRKTLPLASQIEAWLKLQILTGEIETGGRLPSVDTLAQRFDVNVNTAREAISRLADMDLVRVVHGKGAFVATQVSGELAARIRSLVSDTRAKASTLGLSSSEVASLLWAADTAGDVPNRYWFADVAQPYRDLFVKDLERELNAPVHLLDMGGLAANTADEPSGPSSGDIVLTRFRFLGQVRSHLEGVSASVFPLRTRLEAQGMFKLGAAPETTRLGCICIAEHFAQSLGRAIRRYGLDFPQEHAGVDQPAEVARVYEHCDVIATTCAGLEGLRSLYPGGFPKPTVNVKFEIDPASLAVVKSRLGELGHADNAASGADWHKHRPQDGSGLQPAGRMTVATEK